ncbi:sodium-dependent phosphate transporter [Caloranaerobacter sp. TR13]|uniref:Na/Pi cotransporter family protein n=1 Tax=Caloranaerobacter sp. TR13 TaxID=1302151 RepID=UPI0006D40E3F|nr:Na/Pi symporter [Caloranaerobacter sp. TR13]KPU27749.1 sodium-dependent phosphate transporter [Caloranaerobacter sp. TR13]
MKLLKEIHYIIILLSICAGLLLFLLGIKIISTSFEKIVSKKLKIKLYKLTNNKILGVLLGVIITGLLQSSSATTLLVISLVHSNLISIYNAVPIIMGANIGTTITSQIVAIDIKKYAVYLLLAGITTMPLLKKDSTKIISKLLIGISLIFLGIDIISNSIALTNSTKKLSLLIQNIGANDILGIFSGFLITTIIHSSSTGIAILQIMASSHIISVRTSIPIILGQNIGTCIDALIGSLVTNRAGKQAAFVHIIFNISGVIIFYYFINYLYNFVSLISPDNPSRQIANAHTLFNIITTLLLLPFSSTLVNISKKLIKE